MRIFIAGIMQGSIREPNLHGQDYRALIRESLLIGMPEAEIYDPFAGHRESLDYDDEQARRVFLEHNRLCGDVELLIAYVPEASMGTAIEMWEAWQSGGKVVAISPLEHNWAIRFTSHLIYPSLSDFCRDAEAGKLIHRLEEQVS